ncbi:MAG: hypothetical protein KDD50_11990, partial [Bdellovibrionales bacterium]|nr:hypothetical protein [Bdellovibrionales bacterium]
MSIDAIRNAFKIYSYANHNEYVAQINKILFGAGINYKKFDDLEVLKKEFQTNPPHILLFYFESGCVADLTI